MRERDMRPIVAEWLKDQGLQCVYEVMVGGYCDIVGFRFKPRLTRLIPELEKVIAVELKVSKIAEVRRQAKGNQPSVNESWAAMPSTFCERMRPQTRYGFRNDRIGLLSVGTRVAPIVLPSQKDHISDRLRKNLWRHKRKMEKEAVK